MASDYASLDSSNVPGLLELAEEVRRSRRPRLLKRADEELALIVPLTRTLKHSAIKQKSAADMDTFWSSFGS